MFKNVGGVDGFLRSQVLLDNNQEAFLTWLKARIRADERKFGNFGATWKAKPN